MSKIDRILIFLVLLATVILFVDFGLKIIVNGEVKLDIGQTEVLQTGVNSVTKD